MIDSLRLSRIATITVAGALIVATIGCDSPTAPDNDFDPTDGITLPGGGTLVFEGAARLAAHRPTIERVVRDTVAAVLERLPVDGVTVIARAGTSLVIPEIGIGGRADAGTVRLAFDPDSPVLADALEQELFPLLAHELHHVARSRTVGYGNDLLGAMVSEGLADQFSVEIARSDPPLWSSALTDDELATWRARAREQWFDRGYDHDAWFFGTGGTIPRWAGYSIGFAIVGEYLATDPSRSAAGLFDQPATAFVE